MQTPVQVAAHRWLPPEPSAPPHDLPQQPPGLPLQGEDVGPDLRQGAPDVVREAQMKFAIQLSCPWSMASFRSGDPIHPTTRGGYADAS